MKSDMAVMSKNTEETLCECAKTGEKSRFIVYDECNPLTKEQISLLRRLANARNSAKLEEKTDKTEY